MNQHQHHPDERETYPERIIAYLGIFFVLILCSSCLCAAIALRSQFDKLFTAIDNGEPIVTIPIAIIMVFIMFAGISARTR